MRRRDGYEQMYLREYPGIFRLALAMVGDRIAAEDIAQETFSRLYVHFRKVSRYEQPRAWLRRVAIQQASRVRSRRRHRSLNEFDEQEAPSTERDLDLMRAVRALPTSQRAAIVMHYLEGRSVRELADLMGWTPGTAKTHLHRARKNLASALGEVAEDVVG